MSLIRHAARSMLASYFVVGGLDALRDPDSKAEVSGETVTSLAGQVGLPDDDAATLIRANGAVQVGAGLALISGKASRPAALALAGTLVPTTLGEHRFWEAPPGAARGQQMLHFLKNLGLFGSLLIVALDTKGKPGMAYRTGMAVRRGSTLADHKREILELQAELARERAKAATASTRTRVASTARQARRDAKLAGKTGRSAGRAVAGAGRTAKKAVKAATPH
jgi:putative oxidoreductase